MDKYTIAVILCLFNSLMKWANQFYPLSSHFCTQTTTTIWVITKSQEHIRLWLMYSTGQHGGSLCSCCPCPVIKQLSRESRDSNSVVSDAQFYSTKSAEFCYRKNSALSILPSILLILELCMSGKAWRIFLRSSLAHTMNAFIGRLIWGSLLPRPLDSR